MIFGRLTDPTVAPTDRAREPSWPEEPVSASIDAVLQAAVDSGAVPNVVAVAADRDGVIYEGGAGPLVIGGSDTVGPDTTYRIASMTKMIGTVAALQLVERGALDLNAPVEQYLPEFANLQVLEGFDGDTPRFRPPASKATVQHLITHTSGLAYHFFNADIFQWEKVTGAPGIFAGSMETFTVAAGRRPRHQVRVRRQHRLARPGGRGGQRPVAGQGARRATSSARSA